MQVIPAINAQSLAEVKEKLGILKKFVPRGSWLQLDVGDGIFSSIETWRDPVEFGAMKNSYKWEIHLMVENPEDVAELWLKAGAGRLAVHLEAMRNSALIMDLCQKYDAELMLAINPETIAENLIPYFHNIRHFLVLAVPPGKSGQTFGDYINGFTTPINRILEKVEFLRERAPDARIEVDGGVNLDVARKVKEAGADIVAVASHIFKSHNPEAAYRELGEI
ncbi:MAG: hypothetical protein ABH822_01325 [Patescibacteria group bacterium]